MGNKGKSGQVIVVIGMGVVGLPAALMLARAEYKVFGVDIDKNIIDLLKKGKLPNQVKERELELFLKEPKVKSNLEVQQTPVRGDVFIIAVPTPLDKSRKKADLSFVKKACESIVPFLEKGNLVIVESTIPPLTCRNFVTPILESGGLLVGKDIFLAHCPERILPGNIYHEIVYNDRIVGGVNEKSSEMAKKVYATFVKGGIYKTDDVTAELCKLTENAYRDVNIAFANEIALVSDRLGIDYKEVVKLVNKHPRVKVLNPGIGVGGHCIPLDPWFIYEVDSKNSQLIATSRAINDKMPEKIAGRIHDEIKGLKDPKVVAVGASYKSDVSDIRESPAIEIVKILRKDGLRVDHYDPLIGQYKYPKTLVEACKGADILVILVPHKVVLKDLNKNRKKIEKALKTSKIIEF